MLRKLKNISKIYIRHIQTTLKEIFKNPIYWMVAIVSAIVLLAVIVLLPNHELIRITLFGDIFTFKQKFKILFASFGAFETNFTIQSQILSTLIALLIGINTAMLVYYFRTRMAIQKVAGASVFGMMVSLLGVGCSACGSVILSTLFGFSSAGVFVSFLPFNGLEFSILSVLIIFGSIAYISKKIQTPSVCKSK